MEAAPPLPPPPSPPPQPPLPPPLTVGCTLNVYEAEANDASFNAANEGGHAMIIDVRIKLRYQLCIPACGLEEFIIDDVTAPEVSTLFPMASSEVSETDVSSMLESLGTVDAYACTYLSPKIADFAVGIAKHPEVIENSNSETILIVAEVGITQLDYILEDEFHRLAAKYNIKI